MTDGPCQIIINTGSGGNSEVYEVFESAAGLISTGMYPGRPWADRVAAIERAYLTDREALDRKFIKSMRREFDVAEAAPTLKSG